MTTTARDDVRLMLGDCLERMGEIEDGSVDLVAADLPYGTTRNRWDVTIPFDGLWKEFRRALAQQGAVVLTASQPFTSSLVISNPDWFRYCLVWEKPKGSDPLNARVKPLKSHEDIAIFSPRSTTYNPQFTDGSPYLHRGDCRVKSRNFGAAREINDRGSPDGKRFPKSVLRFASEGMSAGNHHPTQKPVALFEYLIRTYSNEGETVLDCTMGSGTTGVACVNTGRNFIGIERDPGYFQIATDRIEAARAATPLLA